jgi:hypothetical protein
VANDSRAAKSKRQAKRADAQARSVTKLKLLKELQRRIFYARAIQSFSQRKELSVRDRNLSEFGQ